MEKDGRNLPPTPFPPGPRVAAVACDVAALAVHRASAAEIAPLRKAPGCFGGSPVAANLLRHSDEQTVVGLAALLRAAGLGGFEPGDFAGWAVLAAPRFLGRAAFEVAFPQYMAEGAWGVSPHLIPAHSLHSPSGTFSQAIKAHGPNLGVGGTPGGNREAMLAAATWLEAGIVPGVWVVVSDRVDCRRGMVAVESPGDYEAAALALVPSRVGGGRPRLLVTPDALRLDPSAGPESDRATVAGWLDATESPAPEPGPSWRVDPGHREPGLSPHLRPEFAPVNAERARR